MVFVAHINNRALFMDNRVWLYNRRSRNAQGDML